MSKNDVVRVFKLIFGNGKPSVYSLAPWSVNTQQRPIDTQSTLYDVPDGYEVAEDDKKTTVSFYLDNQPCLLFDSGSGPVIKDHKNNTRVLKEASL